MTEQEAVESWEEIRRLCGGGNWLQTTSDEVHKLMHAMLLAPAGRARLSAELDSTEFSKPEKRYLFRELARVGVSGVALPGVPAEELTTIYRLATRAAQPRNATEPTFWLLLGVRDRLGDEKAGAELCEALALRSKNNKGLPLVRHLAAHQGWAALPTQRQVELLELAGKVDKTADRKAQINEALAQARNVIAPVPAKVVPPVPPAATVAPPAPPVAVVPPPVVEVPAAIEPPPVAPEPERVSEKPPPKPREKPARPAPPSEVTTAAVPLLEFVQGLAEKVNDIHLRSEAAADAATATLDRLKAAAALMESIGDKVNGLADARDSAAEEKAERAYRKAEAATAEAESARAAADTAKAALAAAHDRAAAAEAKIAAAERRATDYAHERESAEADAIATYKANLWAAIRKHFVGVDNPPPDDAPTSDNERVLWEFFRGLKRDLKEHGLPPA